MQIVWAKQFECISFIDILTSNYINRVPHRLHRYKTDIIHNSLIDNKESTDLYILPPFFHSNYEITAIFDNIQSNMYCMFGQGEKNTKKIAERNSEITNTFDELK